MLFWSRYIYDHNVWIFISSTCKICTICTSDKTSQNHICYITKGLRQIYKRLYQEHSIDNTNIHISKRMGDYPHSSLLKRVDFSAENLVTSIWTEVKRMGVRGLARSLYRSNFLKVLTDILLSVQTKFIALSFTDKALHSNDFTFLLGIGFSILSHHIASFLNYSYHCLRCV